MTIATIVLAITGVFGGAMGTGGPPSKDTRTLKKRLAGKAAEALPAIIGSVVGAILSFLERSLDLLLNTHGP